MPHATMKPINAMQTGGTGGTGHSGCRREQHQGGEGASTRGVTWRDAAAAAAATTTTNEAKSCVKIFNMLNEECVYKLVCVCVLVCVYVYW